MKPSHLLILYLVIVLLGTGLSLFSLRFVRPADCRQLCNTPEQTPCPNGACRAGEQRAGLPLPFLVDNPGGSSPTSGWGILGAEDIPNPFTFFLDILFYSVLLWLVWTLIQILRGKERHLEIKTFLPALALLLVVLLVGFILYRPFLSR